MQLHKSALSIAVFFLLLSSNIYSQWYQQSSGVNSQLYSVFFVNQTTGFVACDSGKVLRTTNGGNNWTVSIVRSDSVYYRSIYFVNQSTGYIAGRIVILQQMQIVKPIIMKTTDSGISWNSVLNDSGYTLRSVNFINSNTGFACGGLYFSGPGNLLMTTNGGVSWQFSSLNTAYLFSITFTDVTTGYMISNHNILKTTNSGINWNQFASLSFPLSSAAFLNKNTGFAVGGDPFAIDSSGRIFRTLNGGSTWDTVYMDRRGMLNDIKFVNSLTGFALGTPYAPPILPNRILKTTNSGSNWFIDTLFSSIGQFTSIFFTDQNTGYAVGGNGVIIKTTNGGNVIGIFPISSEVPKVFSLSQNYPNPFNPETKIKFSLPKSAFTKINIYDVLGREVGLIVNQQLNAGEYEVSWNANNYPSGIYFYKIQADDPGTKSGTSFTQTKRMVLVK